MSSKDKSLEEGSVKLLTNKNIFFECLDRILVLKTSHAQQMLEVSEEINVLDRKLSSFKHNIGNIELVF